MVVVDLIRWQHWRCSRRVTVAIYGLVQIPLRVYLFHIQIAADRGNTPDYLVFYHGKKRRWPTTSYSKAIGAAGVNDDA